MIDVNRAERTLKERYDTLTEVSKHIFRATDTYDSRTYAVRYLTFETRWYRPPAISQATRIHC